MSSNHVSVRFQGSRIGSLLRKQSLVSVCDVPRALMPLTMIWFLVVFVVIMSAVVAGLQAEERTQAKNKKPPQETSKRSTGAHTARARCN